jgi:molybdopterin molybdotransferase
MEQIGIELEQAVEIILNTGNRMKRTQSVFTKEANGRILAEDIYASFDNPPFHRSPLDGFALRSKDLVGASKEMPKPIRVIDTVYAGGFCNQTLNQGEAVRIMTGAPIPDGADCVIRLEDINGGFNEENTLILVDRELEQYENFCFKGEDVKKGTLLLQKDVKLTYIEQGILSSLGVEQVKVYDKLRVAVFATGDELVEPGTELKPGKIYDSNLLMLYARLCEFGITPVIAKHLSDEPEKVAGAIKVSCERVDLVITTGGVSVGDKDIFHEVLPLLKAERLFWKVNLKPGTPAMFAIYEGVPMFHLSGNPFAAATTFELLVRPYIAKAGRDESLYTVRTKAVLEDDFIKVSNGRRFIRGKMEAGKVSIPPAAKHSSGMLASMTGCNCLIDIPAGSMELYKGSEVEILFL